MHTIIILIGIPLISHAFTHAAKWVKLPQVVALIIGGLFLGMPYFKDLMTMADMNLIVHLGDVGLLMLMFFAGFETNSQLLLLELKDASLIAFFGILFPFIIGFLTMWFLGYGLLVAFVMGVCLSISAEATQAKVLLDLNKLKTKVGTLLMEAGLIDDILGLGLFIFITFLLQESYPKENILLAGVILAYLVGVLFRKKIHHKSHSPKKIEKIASTLIIPFFFVSMGLSFDYKTLLVSPKLFMLILAIAMGGKFLGVFVAKIFTTLRWKQLHLIGWAMNSRGAIELALAMIAFRIGIIPIELYSSLVVMALITTMSFPFVIGHMIKKQPKLMN